MFWQSWFNVDPHHVLRSLVYDIWPNIAASAILGTAIFWRLYKKDKCASCWRPGVHRVEGTHYRTCHKHSNSVDHKKLREQHRRKYPVEHKLLNGGKRGCN
jgi:hypothetical protein